MRSPQPALRLLPQERGDGDVLDLASHMGREAVADDNDLPTWTTCDEFANVRRTSRHRPSQGWNTASTVPGTAAAASSPNGTAPRIAAQWRARTPAAARLRCAGPAPAMRLVLLLLSPVLSALAAQAAPVLGPPALLGNVSGATDTLPQIAYDHFTDRYCVVWNANNGTVPGQIHAQMLNGSGNPVGPMIVVSTNARLTRPAIANIRTTGKFLIGWTEETGSGSNYTLLARARSLDASNAALSASVVVASVVSGPSQAVGLNIDIGGDSRNGFLGSAEAALVAWQEVRQGSTSILNSKVVRCRTVQVPNTGTPVLGAQSTLSTSGGGAPRVTRHGGVTGRWGVVWPSTLGLPLSPTNLVACVVDATGPCTTQTLATVSTQGLSLEAPCCATEDGVNFAAAWVTGGVVNVRPFSLTGVCPGVFTAGATVTPFTTTLPMEQPSIDFAESKYVIACRTLSTTDRVRVKSLDPATCASCGVEWFTDAFGASQDSPAVCAKHSGSPNADDRAMVVWSNGTIEGRPFEASTSSLPVTLGGGCGAVGLADFATYDGQCVLGNDTFSVSLFAPTSPILALLIGFTPAPLSCGPCTLIPSLDVVAFGAPSTVVIPIPCQSSLIGGELYTQWLQLRPSGCPIFPDLGLSNALKFTIAE